MDPFVDFSEYDTDGDGMVDHIMVVHAGKGQESWNSSDEDIWSHHYYVHDANMSQAGSQPLMADGVRIFGYSMVSEHSQVGTFVHEFGHDLGLPDLYDIDGSSYGIGRWGVMSSGSWNGGGASPAHFCAWSKVKLGWVSPVEVMNPRSNMTISQVETGGKVYKLPIGDPLTSDEYFLLENRQQVGYDQKLPGSGLLIWHVDDEMYSNTEDHHRLVDLEEANEEIQGDTPYQSGDPWSDNALGFNMYSIPNSLSYGGLPSGWTIKDIGPSEEDMIISIDIIADDVGVSFLLFQRYSGEGIPVDIEAHVFNFGINDQVDVGLVITITQGTEIVDRTTRTIPSLISKRSLVEKFVFTPSINGNYLITARTNLTGDQAPENDQVAEILHVTTILFYDDVESGENDWAHTSNRPPADIWHIVDEADQPGATKSPFHSWFCGQTDIMGTGYIPNTEYYLERSFDVTQVKEGFLIFSHRYDLAFSIQNKSLPRSDTAYVEIRSNLNATYVLLDSYTMTSGGWDTKVYKISNYFMGATQVTIRFRLESEILKFTKGWWLDDILIVGEWYDYDAVVILEEPLVSAAPGDSRSLGVTIWNIGSDSDTYYLSAKAPPYWDVTLGTEVMSIEALRSGLLTMIFKASDTALAGDDNEVVFELVSKGDSSVLRQATLTVIVKRTYGLEVDAGPKEEVEPGTTLTFVVNVTNEGNGLESVHLNLSGSGSTWSNLSIDSMQLEPFEMKQVDLLVNVPLEVKAGDKAEVKVLASTTSGIEDTGIKRFVFMQVHGVALEVVLDDISVTPDNDVDLRYSITNLGNCKDEFDISYVTPPGWDVDGDLMAVLGPWETMTVTITVDIPDASPLSEFKVRAKVQSRNDDKTHEEVALKVTVVLPDPAIVELKLSKTYVTGKENITITVVIENQGTGNATDIMVGFFDNGDNIHTMMIDNLGTGDSEILEFSWRFKDGHHDVAAVITYEGAQAYETNDEAHKDLKVKDESGFIPGLGAMGIITAVPVAILLRRKK